MSFLDASPWQSAIFSRRWVRSAGGDAPVVEPATAKELGRVGVALPEDVVAAAKSAVRSQRKWAAASYDKRAAVLRQAGLLLEQHAKEIEDWIVRESGSVTAKAAVEVRAAAQECYEAAALASAPWGELLRSARPRMSFARRIPVGVVGVIAPFNFPLILAMRSVAPALAVGNAVVLKPDQRTAVCGGVVLARIFEEAGLPIGLLHVLPGDKDTGEALVQHPDVPVISFTGSTEGGRAVGVAGARHFKRVHLELGGNNALIVFNDADLDLAVSAAAWGSWLHQGQICMTAGRHIVHDAVVGEYVERLAAKADSLPVGDPATGNVALGPIIDSKQRKRVHQLVTASVSGGARLAAGGHYDGLFYRPTVLADVTRDSPAYANEVFGPVAPVITFSTLDEAVQLAASTEFGLSLGVLTSDVMKGLEIADRVPAGMVHINDQTVDDEAVAPFGGVLSSGSASRLGGTAANAEAFTETQWVTLQGAITRYPL